jgi:hypothetical protein
MTLAHRAFALDYAAFEQQLRPLLVLALETDDPAALEAWIDDNIAALVDPYEGEPLPANWRKQLENGDVHELGDYALTKFYDGDLDMGLDVDWERLAELLEESGSSGALLLGSPLGAADREFDPGRQGAYFQSPDEVKAGLAALRALLEAQPALASDLAPVQGMLQQAARNGHGLFVTF